MQEFKSFIELWDCLNDKTSCREFLEKHRWQGDPICPHCGDRDKHYKLKSKGEFNGLYKCKCCRKRFTVTVGTMFEGSNIPLKKWFYAIYLFLSHKKGISSVQLAKDAGITQKTAWFMLNRIRHNCKGKTHISFDNETQIDETYVGGKAKGRGKGTQGRSLKFKTPVVGLISDKKAYAIVVPNTTADILHPIIKTLVKQGSTIVTDGWGAYKGLKKKYHHEVVKHSQYEYVNKNGFHTNSIEGFWSHLKRGILGIYHLVSPKHLQKYCDEFEFRYNTRDMDDISRFIMFVATSYRRLKYKDLANGESAWLWY
ncbi:IS1595 family transposase [Dysgonomonas sp. 520]|uniref:IS1595 family transposase n=1 Tax=Dysgonomonas sp. 520 TaxID=2302931 RepID=UPI0013D54B90|nr:IS1595 family transposase [Dysgonomonas sp. 520]NDW09399.1 IS1595 family transposase [Dysgonomonas sp. 520]